MRLMTGPEVAAAVKALRLQDEQGVEAAAITAAASRAPTTEARMRWTNDQAIEAYRRGVEEGKRLGREQGHQAASASALRAAVAAVAPKAMRPPSSHPQPGRTKPGTPIQPKLPPQSKPGPVTNLPPRKPPPAPKQAASSSPIVWVWEKPQPGSLQGPPR